MESRRTPRHSRSQAVENGFWPQETYFGGHGSGFYSNPTRHLRKPSYQRVGADNSESLGQRARIEKPASCSVAGQSLYTTGSQEANELEDSGYTSLINGSEPTTSSHPTVNNVYFNSGLAAQNGSQFSPPESILQGPRLNSLYHLSPEIPDRTSPYPGFYRRENSGISYTSTAKTLPDRHDPLSEISFTHHSNAFMTKSPGGLTLSTPEPWASVDKCVHIESMSQRHQRTPAPYPAANLHSNYDSSKYLNLRNDSMSGSTGLSADPKESPYNTATNKDVHKSGFHHGSVIANIVPGSYYVQGRSAPSQMTTACGPAEPVPFLGDTDTLSRLEVSPIAPSTSNSSSHQVHSTASCPRRSSIKTSTTTMSNFSQGSRSSNKRTGYDDVPDPLECSKCVGAFFTGESRRSNLQRHLREKHQMVRARCPVCKEEFSRPGNLTRHQLTKHHITNEPK